MFTDRSISNEKTRNY